MPWSVKKDDRCPTSEPWAVVKDDDGELEGCHASKQAAEKQQAALYASEGRAERAEWSTAYINDLPDSAFAYIESGGSKDDEGKTTPRSLRHFPHHNDAGTLDLPHLRNALSRGPQSDVWPNGQQHLNAHAKEAGVGEASAALPRPLRDNIERSLARFTVSDDEELPTLAGHLAVFGEWTRISSMFEGEFMERIAPGSFAKTITENRDRVQITFNHGHDPSLGDQVLADLRELREDDTGAYYEADLFPEIPPLLMRGLRHGKYGASFRFSVVKEEPARWWEKRPTKETEHNPDRLPERTIRELALYEFGPVTYPAYAGATAGVRSTTDYYMSQRLTGDPERLLSLISSARALPEEGAEEKPHSAPGSRVIAVPTPKRFRSREDFLKWTSRI